MNPTTLTVAVTGLALALVAVWILRPLQLPRARMASPDDEHWRELVETKQQLYRSILDLEFDQSVGKVSDADYLVLRRQQESEALAVLDEMDRLAGTRPGPAGGAGVTDPGGTLAEPADGSASPQDRLEAEIAAARLRLRPQAPRSDS
jgi:hypothetical protein